MRWTTFLAACQVLLLAAPSLAQQAAPTPPASPPAPLQRPATPLTGPGTPAATLPNGATSITETYGDWTMACRISNARRLCLISQSQGDNRTGQRVFAIELAPPREGTTAGTILMPFGLTLENGALLKLDDTDLGEGIRFSTCVPQGCLLPVSLPKAATDAMKTAQRLTVAALNITNGEVVSFNVSLNGFGPALDRAAQLGD